MGLTGKTIVAFSRYLNMNKKTGKVYDVFQDVQKHINDQLTANQKATFIEHYLNTYDNPPTPPSWMSVELLYFSELSKICQNLNLRKDRTDIASFFGVKDDASFAHGCIRSIISEISAPITPGYGTSWLILHL